MLTLNRKLIILENLNICFSNQWPTTFLSHDDLPQIFCQSCCNVTVFPLILAQSASNYTVNIFK